MADSHIATLTDGTPTNREPVSIGEALPEVLDLIRAARAE